MNNKKFIAAVAAGALALGCTIGGTVAWLTAKTDTITNTFTTSDITVTLTETKENFQMIPGWTIDKDPTVAVDPASEDCYVFVKVEESANFDEYMTYTVDSGWTQLKNGETPVNGVFYREVVIADGATAASLTYPVLAGNKVTVLGTVDKEDMAAAKTSAPTLTFTAYASQLYKDNTNKFDAYTAWINIA